MADLPDGYFNLKHRLVGATALILVAVILLPRVLTGTDVDSVRSSANVGTALQIQPRVLSVGLSDSGSAEVSTRARIEIIEQPDVARTDDETRSVQSSDFHSGDGIEDQNGEIALQSRSSISKSIVKGFIVQVGIFQRPENSKNLITSLKKDGINAKVETLEIDGRQFTRIWLGPFSTRSEATREGNKAMMRSHSKPIVKEWP